MLKVMTIVGTRPEIIKLSRVIAEIDKYMEHVLVHTGQNYDYELNEIFFNEMNLRKPDYYLGVEGKTTAEKIGQIISKTDILLEKVKPDAVLLYGDTNSCLSIIAAKRRHIPIFHMEAGNRCFDQRVPEEINRKIVDHLSDINMTLTEHARRYLIREGIQPETVIKTGSCMHEVLNYYRKNIESSMVLHKLKLEANNYFVWSTHREENIDSDKNFTSLVETLMYLCDVYKKKVVFSAHPRTLYKINELNLKMPSLVQIMRPLGFFDYIFLQKNSFCTISDSGTITEEAGLLGFPAVTIRNAHERPEGMDAGVLIMSGLRAERVREAIDIVTTQFSENGLSQKVEDYKAECLSKKVVRIIQSYTEYINRTVWNKHE